MADKEVIEFDIDTNADEAGEKFVKLQTRIKQTRVELQKAAEAGDSVKFGRLKDQLDDLEDQLEKTQLQSKKFGDVLATVPGPAGTFTVPLNAGVVIAGVLPVDAPPPSN